MNLENIEARENVVPLVAKNALQLQQIGVGQRCTVTRVYSSNLLLRSKLLTMGIVPGQQIEMLGAAPLGDPISIRVLGFVLSLRRSEAACIEVVAENYEQRVA